MSCCNLRLKNVFLYSEMTFIICEVFTIIHRVYLQMHDGFLLQMLEILKRKVYAFLFHENKQ